MEKYGRKKIITPTWKRAITILIHKKDSTDNPGNFRPIILEIVTLKILTSALRNKVCQFLTSNNYIETNIQTGFVNGISGTFKHTNHLAYVINNARKSQRSLTVTLLDLRNAFGEVHHNLIDCVLEYHHVPENIREIVKNLYCCFKTSILTDEFVTDFVHMQKGVLQGDCFSPLIFKLIINTFIQSIKHEKYEQFGYKFIRYLTPRHWYQFADDAAVISGLERENQILLNVFARWCSWANMIIRVDKCHSFGLKKSGTSSKQFQSKLFLNNELIPAVKQDEYFTYLGRHFDYKCRTTSIKKIF